MHMNMNQFVRLLFQKNLSLLSISLRHCAIARLPYMPLLLAALLRGALRPLAQNLWCAQGASVHTEHTVQYVQTLHTIHKVHTIHTVHTVQYCGCNCNWLTLPQVVLKLINAVMYEKVQQ